MELLGDDWQLKLLHMGLGFKQEKRNQSHIFDAVYTMHYVSNYTT